MSSHRDFTPDDDEDELLLPPPRQPESPRQDRSTRPSSASNNSQHPPPAVTSIRLKIGGGGASKRHTSTMDHPAQEMEQDDALDAGHLGERIPTLAKGKGRGPSQPASSSETPRPSSSAGTRKRVLSNPSEPPEDSDIHPADAGALPSRKRAKRAVPVNVQHPRPSMARKYLNGGRGPHSEWSNSGGSPEFAPYTPLNGPEEDALLADELSLMAEEVAAKRSIKGSSPHRLSPRYDDPVTHGLFPAAAVGPREIVATGDSAPQVFAAAAAAADAKSRPTPESSPEIELVSATYNQRLVPQAPATAAVPRKKKAWLKSAKLIPIAPNPGAAPFAASVFGGTSNAVSGLNGSAVGPAFGTANAGNSMDPNAYTPPTNYYTIDKRKSSKKSRAAAAKAAHLVSSPNPESLDGDSQYGRGGGADPRSGFPYASHPADEALDMALLGEGEEVKPKKKKSKKLKAGETGPGKHWRKGVFGPHTSRLPGGERGDMSEMGGESPNSIAAGSSHGGGRLLLPKPTAGGGNTRKRGGTAAGRNVLTPSGGGDDDHTMMVAYDRTGGTPDEYDDFENNASNRSSPEISMRNDPTISLSRPLLQQRASHAAGVIPAFKPKPLIEGPDGEYIVPKLAAQSDKLGHPIYRNSILTRGISIIRIQDFSGAKAKERELTVPRALKENLGPKPRQFDEGYRIITGVGGAKLKLRSWIPRTLTSEFRMERDAKIEEIRAAEAATTTASHNNAESSAIPSRPALYTSASQRNLSLEGMTPEAWPINQAQIHHGQQVRKYSAFVPTPDTGVTPPKKPAKKKKKKKVVKSAPELLPDMPSPQLNSQVPSAAPSPDIMLDNPMDGILAARDGHATHDQSPYVDDLIMDAV
ncbi:hypothetical protein QFC19_009022 [Naganishia cerealis]|uniref:Uncharacterized protein n=1 Tax=Naganishia cerealis TaxID=610337 RepID=A0ACC2UZ58_9TREE|nr:hypothetical protein QFC19_009022 [Naganishia cerealis]